jgi:hypothetical protein
MALERAPEEADTGTGDMRRRSDGFKPKVESSKVALVKPE